MLTAEPAGIIGKADEGEREEGNRECFEEVTPRKIRSSAKSIKERIARRMLGRGGGHLF